MSLLINRTHAALGLAGAAAAWPGVMCAITEAMRSPLERVMQTSWCGATPQALFAGHCALCWGGTAALLLAAVLMLAPNRQRAHSDAA